MPIYRLLPFAAAVFVIAAVASMGLPGFSGFPAELTILIGAWNAAHAWAAVAALGIFIAAAFTLRAVQLGFFGGAREPEAEAPPRGQAGTPHYGPISLPEKTGAVLLVAATVLVGVRPDLLLDWINPALQSPLFQAVLKGGAP